MSLRDLTKEKHDQAEQTKFMQAVIAGTIDKSVWADFLFQKIKFYSTLETVAIKAGLLTDLDGLRRIELLIEDFNSVKEDKHYQFNEMTLLYCAYLKSIENDTDKIMAHVYTWHMGDLFGGQLIKSRVPGSHKSLTFENAGHLASLIRKKLKDSMAAEVCEAFEWSIKLMDVYEI